MDRKHVQNAKNENAKFTLQATHVSLLQQFLPHFPAGDQRAEPPVAGRGKAPLKADTLTVFLCLKQSIFAVIFNASAAVFH